MYLRFVSGEIDPDSHVSQGLFTAAIDLRDSGTLEEHESIWFADVVGWFNRNLKVPEEFDLRLRYDSKEYERVIYWFRGSAKAHIQRMREVATMLKYHGIAAHLLRTDKPGRVVYSDQFQIAAIPHRDGVK